VSDLVRSNLLLTKHLDIAVMLLLKDKSLDFRSLCVHESRELCLFFL
jgi:hypothetical protein